ncbi:MAG TPA: amidohydrolase family protein [Bryobacteraceae bacterium]|nr:amidohydrolase family protein [Bryobacteraceae bacterium]
MTRRTLLGTAAGVTAASAMMRMRETLIDTHIHLFSEDQRRFPFSANGVYKPEARPLKPYLEFASDAELTGVVIVHPEPYQDDHRYLEHCFRNEPFPGFFKGTCLYDPIAADTPDRMAELVRRHPKRIIALRIHVNRTRGEKPTVSGPIRDRDLMHPGMRTAWRKAHDLGLAIQMHTIPLHAPEIGRLARDFSDTVVVIDHLARAGQGTPEEYDRVLELAKLPKVVMKFSGVRYSSKQDPPHRDAAPLIRRTYDAFGPDRMIWGGLGMTMAEFRRNRDTFDTLLGFASAADRAKIAGLTATRLFGWTPASGR